MSIFLHNVPSDFKKKKNKEYVAVIGSRSIKDEDIVFSFIKEILPTYSNIVLISGGASGVDTAAEFFADDNDIEFIKILPAWEKYGKVAGMLRNTSIIDLADRVIALQKANSQGTDDSIFKAIKKKIPVHIKKFK